MASAHNCAHFPQQIPTSGIAILGQLYPQCCQTQILIDNSIYAPILTLMCMESIDGTMSCQETWLGGIL